MDIARPETVKIHCTLYSGFVSPSMVTKMIAQLESIPKTLPRNKKPRKNPNTQ